ncbi:helix-turn-helix domain-containing protein [Enterococcus ureasiticus]|uniref:helix-turn-helix transcriptional regulator n=1 Tax=Enterococcus ureasiticus TaxID=903984 RepID=UPI001A909F45|nr:helix-turn-helix domain-containing protein [Enterococcus ureasiticus]MBO0473278.1 helix-turn-helix domain-containing protein [Enterococcus ureasiticus]
MFKKKEPVYVSHLNEIRRAKGLSVEELAEKVRVSKQTIDSIELEKHKLSLELAYEISGALDCRLEEVFPRVGGK